MRILEPLARACKCLESSKATAGDVYHFWLAVLATYKQYIWDNNDVDGLQLPDEVIDDIRIAVNARWRELTTGLGKGVYVSTFFLDPREFIICSACDDMRGLILHFLVGYIKCGAEFNGRRLHRFELHKAELSRSRKSESKHNYEYNKGQAVHTAVPGQGAYMGNNASHFTYNFSIAFATSCCSFLRSGRICQRCKTS